MAGQICRVGEATPAGAALRPLTERILEELPGPRVAWIAACALVPLLNAGANLLLDGEGTSAVWEQILTLVVLNYVALSAAVVIAPSEAAGASRAGSRRFPRERRQCSRATSARGSGR